MNNYRDRYKFKIDGIEFNTLQDAAEHFKVHKNTMQKWKKTGKSYKPESVKIDGVTFKSTREAADHFGVGIATALRWSKIGTPTPKIYVVFGTEFRSRKEAAEFFGVLPRTITSWRKKEREARKEFTK